MSSIVSAGLTRRLKVTLPHHVIPGDATSSGA
jgi:hypothetical protein